VDILDQQPVTSFDGSVKQKYKFVKVNFAIKGFLSIDIFNASFGNLIFSLNTLVTPAVFVKQEINKKYRKITIGSVECTILLYLSSIETERSK
jgi:hypothetical protein